MQQVHLQYGIAAAALGAAICFLLAFKQNLKFKHVAIRIAWILSATFFGFTAAYLFSIDSSVGKIGRFGLGPKSRIIFGVLFSIAAISVIEKSTPKMIRLLGPRPKLSIR